MIKNTRLANTWPWNKEWIALAFFLPGVSGLGLIYFALPVMGNIAYWFLAINLWGFLFAVIYKMVNKKMHCKMKSLKEKGLIPFEGLIAFGKLQAPAAMAISKDTFYFSPIVGKELSYPLKQIQKAELKCALPGKHLIFKVAYQLTLENDAIISFAVNKQVSKVIKSTLFQELSPT